MSLKDTYSEDEFEHIYGKFWYNKTWGQVYILELMQPGQEQPFHPDGKKVRLIAEDYEVLLVVDKTTFSIIKHQLETSERFK